MYVHAYKGKLHNINSHIFTIKGRKAVQTKKHAPTQSKIGIGWAFGNLNRRKPCMRLYMWLTWRRFYKHMYVYNFNRFHILISSISCIRGSSSLDFQDMARCKTVATHRPRPTAISLFKHWYLLKPLLKFFPQQIWKKRYQSTGIAIEF